MKTATADATMDDHFVERAEEITSKFQRSTNMPIH